MYFVRRLRIRAPAIHSAVPQDVHAGQERANAKQELMRDTLPRHRPNDNQFIDGPVMREGLLLGRYTTTGTPGYECKSSKQP
jgi:hypothetical protein